MGPALIVLITVNLLMFSGLSAWAWRYATKETSPRLRLLSRGLSVVSLAFVLGAATRLAGVAVELGWLPGRVAEFTGGGWINSPVGAYVAEPELTGKANFGFVSKYKKGASVPDGQTEFQFHAGNFRFHSSSYQWLVISGCKAQYKGTGAVNGVSGYGFLLTAYDGQINGCSSDGFRIKITDSGGTVVYDNRLDEPDDIDTADPLGISGGSIVIHKGK